MLLLRLLVWESHKVNKRDSVTALVRFVKGVWLILSNCGNKLDDSLFHRPHFHFLDFVLGNLTDHGLLSFHI